MRSRADPSSRAPSVTLYSPIASPNAPETQR
jgi:hypothetical protein